MNNTAYTVRIFMPNGDPQGVKIIKKTTSIGCTLAFPINCYDEAIQRPEFKKSGIYILFGQSDDEEDPRDILYIGQTDDFSKRFYNHKREKEFWDKAVIFTSTNPEGLSKMHTAWLEQALIERGRSYKQAKLNNVNCPKAQNISEEDEADVRILYSELLDVLPLVGIYAFSEGNAVIKSKENIPLANDKKQSDVNNIIIVPAKEQGFKDVFMGEDCWYAVRIGKDKLDQLEYIAAYQTYPISSITHYAKIKKIISYGDTGKYKLEFEGSALQLDKPIPYGDLQSGAMQSTRYTNFDKLKSAQKMSDLF